MSAHENRPALALIYVPYGSPSVSYVPLLARSGELTVLERLVAFLINNCGGFRVGVVVCKGTARYDEIRGCCGQATMYAVEARLPLSAMKEVCDGPEPPGDILLCPAALLLAPPALLLEQYRHHRATGNPYTFGVGLPAGVAPEIYRRDFLIGLSEIGVPGLPADPGECVRVIVKASAMDAAIGFDGWRSTAFDASAAYGFCKAMPRSVAFETQADADRLADVLSLEQSSPEVLLCEWRRREIEERQKLVNLGAARLRKSKCTGSRSRVCGVLYASNPSGYSGAEESLCEMISGQEAGKIHAHALVAFEGGLQSDCDSLRLVSLRLSGISQRRR